MLDKVLMILNKALPVGIALNSLGNLNPKLQSFIKGSLAAGYGGNEILNYLRNQASEYNQQLGSTPRPDEEVTKARREKLRQPVDIGKGIATGALALGGGALAASLPTVAEKVIGKEGQEEEQPMVKEKPQTLAQKIPQDVQAQQQQSSPISDPLISLRQKYPELAKFTEKQAIAGNEPSMIAKQARAIVKFRNNIDSIEQEIGESFENLISRLLGLSQAPSQQAQKAALTDAALLKSMGQILQM